MNSAIGLDLVRYRSIASLSGLFFAAERRNILVFLLFLITFVAAINDNT